MLDTLDTTKVQEQPLNLSTVGNNGEDPVIRPYLGCALKMRFCRSTNEDLNWLLNDLRMRIQTEH